MMNIVLKALSLDPTVPGAGRLCQELLSEVSGLPITTETVVSIKRHKFHGGPHNPWGRKGKPK